MSEWFAGTALRSQESLSQRLEASEKRRLKGLRVERAHLVGEGLRDGRLIEVVIGELSCLNAEIEAVQWCGVVLEHCEWNGAVFRNCSFTDVQFVAGLWQNVLFENCYFSRTPFPEFAREALQNGQARLRNCVFVSEAEAEHYFKGGAEQQREDNVLGFSPPATAKPSEANPVTLAKPNPPTAVGVAQPVSGTVAPPPAPAAGKEGSRFDRLEL